MCCLWPVFPSVTRRAAGPAAHPSVIHRAARSGRAQCHGTRCRLCRLCCHRPVFHSVAHRAAGSGPQVLRLLAPSVSAGVDVTSTRKRTVSKLCHRRFLKLVAGLIDFQPPYASATLPRPLSGAAGFTGAVTLLFLSLLRRRPVRAGQGLGPAGPAAGRSPQGAQADQPTRRPARPTGPSC